MFTAKHFVRWLLTVDEEKRPHIDEVIHHPVRLTTPFAPFAHFFFVFWNQFG